MGMAQLRRYIVASIILFGSLSSARATDTPTCDAIFNGDTVPTVSLAYNEAVYHAALAGELARQKTDNTAEYPAISKAEKAAKEAEAKAKVAATKSPDEAKTAREQADQAKREAEVAKAMLERAVADNVLKKAKSPEAKGNSDQNSDMNTVALGDTVSIAGKHLDLLFEKPCDKKTVVLFLNGRPMKGVVRDPLSNPKKEPLHFTLKRTGGANEAWIDILGSPLSRDHHVDVSIGFEDAFALASTDPAATRLTFDVIPALWFLLWLFFFAGLILVFGCYAICTNIIRDPGPVESGSLGVFSLSRLQGAWWFFVIIASYLFIGIITGDFSNSINSTALILLGIGAGTVVGSAAIDAKNDTDAQKQATIASITEVQNRINATDTAIKATDAALKAVPPPGPAVAQQYRQDLANKTEVKERLEKQLGLLQGKSQGFLTDILSDANGISFHRFQIAAFTVILSFVFIYQVYQSLAMPTFNTTLMGMLGLSAGTYLGLKIPEAKTPTTT